MPLLKKRDEKQRIIDYESAEQETDREKAETKFKYLMILCAVFVAFAHGSNDIGNSIAPFSAVLDYYMHGDVSSEYGIPFLVILAGGIGIDIGLALFGYKVMETVGEKITKLTFSKGYSAQFGAAITVLIGTALGIPLSTTSVLIGSVAGTGFAKSGDEEADKGVDWKILVKIMLGWVFTIVVGFFLTGGIYFVLRLAFVE